MCGIVAGVRLQPGPSHLPAVKAMISTLTHRGPDAAGYAIFENGGVALGHVRLSIVDLKAGPQPLSTPDGKITVVFNGEIYDHVAIRKDLESKGHSFRTETDTEVIPALYREYGLDFFKHLNGEFAFILWDSENKRIIATRDRYGIKPLFFHRGSRQIFFCSENKGLLALQEVERKISTSYLTGGFLTAYQSAASAFSGIESLAPGHYMVIEDGNIAEQKAYWQPNFPTDWSLTKETAAEGVRHYLVQAVKRRLVADVPVCGYLSGGIDSALVCGLAAQSGQQIKAFNIGFTNSVFDETQQARHIASHFGLPFETIACPPDVMAKNLIQTIYHTEGVLHNASSIGKLVLSRRVNADGYRVALTGEGADEILAGYPFFKLEALWRMLKAKDGKAAHAKQLLKRFEALESRSEGSLWNKGTDWSDAPQPFGFPSAMYTRAHVYGRLIGHMLHADVLSHGGLPQDVYQRHYNQDSLGSLHPLHASMVITLNQLSNYIFPNMGDRLEMANHVEGRTPFLDRDLSNFAATIPPEFLIDIDNLREKNVLHDAFDSILPVATAREHKHPFFAPSWKGLLSTKEGKEIAAQHLSHKDLEERGLCNAKGVGRLKKMWVLTPKTSVLHRKLDAVMGSVITLQILHSHFIQKAPVRNDRVVPTDMTPRQESPRKM